MDPIGLKSGRVQTQDPGGNRVDASDPGYVGGWDGVNTSAIGICPPPQPKTP